MKRSNCLLGKAGDEKSDDVPVILLSSSYHCCLKSVFMEFVHNFIKYFVPITRYKQPFTPIRTFCSFRLPIPLFELPPYLKRM